MDGNFRQSKNERIYGGVRKTIFSDLSKIKALGCSGLWAYENLCVQRVFESVAVRVIRGRIKSTPFLRAGIFGGGRLGYDRRAGKGPKRRPLGHKGAVVEDRHGYRRLVE